MRVHFGIQTLVRFRCGLGGASLTVKLAQSGGRMTELSKDADVPASARLYEQAAQSVADYDRAVAVNLQADSPALDSPRLAGLLRGITVSTEFFALG
jgi:hypothetical protein